MFQKLVQINVDMEFSRLVYAKRRTLRPRRDGQHNANARAVGDDDFSTRMSMHSVTAWEA